MKNVRRESKNLCDPPCRCAAVVQKIFVFLCVLWALVVQKINLCDPPCRCVTWFKKICNIIFASLGAFASL